MALHLTDSIDIAASPAQVWAILTDFAAYPTWNPFIPQLTGAPVVGSRLEVRLTPPGGQAMTFRPTVLAATPGRELRWLGTLGVRGLFDGEHVFQIEPLGPDWVRFVQSEHFRGLLVPILGPMMRENTRAGFARMNQALKLRAEQQPAPAVTDRSSIAA